VYFGGAIHSDFATGDANVRRGDLGQHSFEAKTIAADRRTLAGHAAAKSWAKPETGFLHIDKRLVKALTDSSGAGLTWLGDDTIASGRDIMHFDTRGVGPIKRIWSSVLGKATGLGNG
jgi:hypothetical protein